MKLRSTAEAFVAAALMGFALTCDGASTVTRHISNNNTASPSVSVTANRVASASMRNCRGACC
jgi:hypothetical protein